VDRFEDILVTEVLSFGIDKRRDMLYPLLVKVLGNMAYRCGPYSSAMRIPSAIRKGCRNTRGSIVWKDSWTTLTGSGDL
jgi:hypothetical protein